MSEKVKIKIARNVVHLPAIALRGLVVFPNNVVHFEVGRTKSIAAIEAAMHANSSVFLIAQREMDIEEPTIRDLYTYGVIAEITSAGVSPGTTIMSSPTEQTAVIASSFSIDSVPDFAAAIMPASSDTGMNAPESPPTCEDAITPPFFTASLSRARAAVVP